MYAKIESERLRYIRLNQRKLRVEEYIHLRDAVANDGNTENLGALVILPATVNQAAWPGVSEQASPRTQGMNILT